MIIVVDVFFFLSTLFLSFLVIPTINDLHHFPKKIDEDHGDTLFCFIRRAYAFLSGRDDNASLFFIHGYPVLSTRRAKASTDFNPL